MIIVRKFFGLYRLDCSNILIVCQGRIRFVFLIVFIILLCELSRSDYYVRINETQVLNLTKACREIGIKYPNCVKTFPKGAMP